MNSGIALKKTLGLEDYLDVYISRIIMTSTKPIYMIFYDSQRKTTALPRRKCIIFPYTGMVYSGYDLGEDKFRRLPRTPLIKIESWNGIIRLGVFVTVDVSYGYYLRKKNFNRFPESLQDDPFVPKNKITEFLTLKDLQKNKGSSTFSTHFRKERNKIMGSETQNAKYIQCKLIDNNHIDFYFLAESTKKYPPQYVRKDAVMAKDYALVPNKHSLYTITIRVIDFVKWLDTYSDKSTITKKDMVDILNVANIQVDSEVPAWYWQGGAWAMQQLDATIYDRNIIAPKHWNKPQYHGDGNFFLDKITQNIFNQINFYANQMAVSATSLLKKAGIL